MQADGVRVLKADKAFVDDVRGKTAPLEQKWVTDAKAEGTGNASRC